jgi:DNA adenine methylase
MSEIKSPLRYPGGKSRAVSQIEKYLPKNFSEYREPFVGGGSLFIYLRQKRPDLKIWINDLNYELYCFWRYAQIDSEKLADAVLKIKKERTDGQALFSKLVHIDVKHLSEFERAVRFFILNRITFSGTVESGGYSQAAFEKRFTYSSIERLAQIGQLLDDVKITNLDYKELIGQSGEDVFIFLDPPYLKATKSKLYGKKGILHTMFDHREFADQVKHCDSLWLITYDDCHEIRKNFAFANIYEWQLQYGMNNYKQGKAEKGNELFIMNYRLPQFFENRKIPCYNSCLQQSSFLF